MHLLIPFAAPGPEPSESSQAGRAALASLALPGLQRVLSLLAPGGRDVGDTWTLSPPHERALARALGWHGADGLLPWAARAAVADGVTAADDSRAWGLLTPGHWHVGTDQVSLIDPAGLLLDDATSRALFDAVRELFTSRGHTMAWGSALRWYLAHDSLATLATASLDRVVGRNVDRWLGEDAAMRPLRLLQSEVQMTLYEHPLNTAREAQGLLPVNSFWLSGCGRVQPARGTEPSVDLRLRAPALSNDWAGWATAWQTLDDGPIAALADQAEREPATPVQLTLCGERTAAAFGPARTGTGTRWLARLGRRVAPGPLLEAL
jgi:hypothetical protein